jgi:hypothetical protein
MLPKWTLNPMRLEMKTIACSALLLAMTLAPLRAQTPAPGNAEQEVRAVISRMFDAMRARDTLALRAVFDSGARLIGTSMRNGVPEVDITPIGDFIRIVATAAPGQLLDERLQNTEVKVSDNLASVWTDYKFYVGERFSHCGVDTFHLAKGVDGWKIVALADTRRPPPQCQ